MYIPHTLLNDIMIIIIYIPAQQMICSAQATSDHFHCSVERHVCFVLVVGLELI